MCEVDLGVKSGMVNVQGKGKKGRGFRGAGGRESLCAMCFDVKKNSDRHSTKTRDVGGAL